MLNCELLLLGPQNCQNGQQLQQKPPPVLDQSKWQDRNIAEYYLALDAGKYCQNNYQVLFISVDIHRRCHDIISITN